ncbi:DMT family transporter [Atopobacter phocae]|uniref:DMT family transporter n=1 Tax=Atopobacter phocae TaxID=136492 RepID=UPI00046F5A17|nr:DMT family transporter [Atopobacter phocae]
MSGSHMRFTMAMLIFGFNGIIAHWIPWESYEIVLARSSIGALFMLVVMALKKKSFVFKKEMHSFRMLIMSGLMLGLNWMFLYEAFQQTGVGMGQILNSGGPVLAIVLSFFLFKEAIEPIKLFSLVFVLAGMVLISQPQGDDASKIALILGLGSSMTFAGLLTFNRLATAIHGMERTFWQLFFASIAVIMYILYKGTGFPDIVTGQVMIPVLIIGVVNTGIAMNLLFSSIPSLTFQSIAILSYLEPLSTLLFAAIFLGERMNGVEMLGATMILGGASLAEWYTWRVSKRQMIIEKKNA